MGSDATHESRNDADTAVLAGSGPTLRPAGVGVGDALAHLGIVEVQAGKVAGVGGVLKAAVDGVRAGIGRSYQRTTIFPNFSVLENCRLAAQARTPRPWAWWQPADRCMASTTAARDAAAKAAQKPVFVMANDYDQIVAAITRAYDNYDLIPCFYRPLPDAGQVAYRHAVMRDLDLPRIRTCIVAFSAFMQKTRKKLAKRALADETDAGAVRLVVNRQQLLAHRQRRRVQPGAGTAGEDDALHGESLRWWSGDAGSSSSASQAVETRGSVISSARAGWAGRVRPGRRD